MENKHKQLAQEDKQTSLSKKESEFDSALPSSNNSDTLDSVQASQSNQELSAEQRRTLIGVIIGIIVLFAATIISIIWLAQPSTDTARVRDIFIIFMGLASLLTTFVLIILIIQLARLLNLIQNELRPILDSLNITISNLRGTTVFLSDNLTEPVIKLNEYLAGLSQLFKVLGLMKKTQSTKNSKGD
jgi:hypothetical protein